jgi:hypothetical protein
MYDSPNAYVCINSCRVMFLVLFQQLVDLLCFCRNSLHMLQKFSLRFSPVLFKARNMSLSLNKAEKRRMPSSGICCRAYLVNWTDVSEERIASMFMIEKSASEEPAWAGGCRLARGFFYLEDGGDTFHRNVGSIDKIYTAPHPRRWHSS